MNIFSRSQQAQKPPQPGTGKVEVDQANEEAQEVNEGAKVVQMRPGDYLVHVHVQSAKQLVIEGEDTVDPFVKTEILNLSKSTSNKNGITPSTQVKYDEHLFLQFSSLTKEQLQDAKIEFSVLNKGFFKGDVIGQFEMSLSKVYNMKDHVMMHQLIGLSNPNSKDFGKITGYIVVSINIQGPGDEATELKLGSELDIKKKKPMVPASIKKQYKQLTLRIYRGENLPLTDSHLISSSTIDAYVKLRYQSCKLQTKIASNCDGKLAEWNQEMLVPIEVPLKDDKIHLQLWDYNDVMPDELCSSMELSIPFMLDVEKEEDGTKTKPTLKWINMYGARTVQGGINSDAANEMNKNPQIASSWKGRILIEYFVEDSKYPLSKVYNIKDQFNPQGIINKLKQSKYFIIGEFGRGLCLPDKKPYRLKISIGKKFWISDAPKQQKNNYCRWDQRFKDEFTESYEKFTRFPFVFIYLLDGDKEICYYKTSAKQFIKSTDENALDPFRVHWQQFDIDKSLGILKDDSFSGIFSFRLYVHDITQKSFDFTQIEPWKTPPPTRLKPQKIRIAIYQCECLPPADSNGTSDPILKVWTPEDQEITTKQCFDTNNPIIYEVKEFSMDFQTIDLAQPIILNIFDYDKGLVQDSYEFMGRSIIFLSDLDKNQIANDERIPYPTWFPIKRRMDDTYDADNGISPAVLCSFSILDFEKQTKIQAKDIKLWDNKMLLNGQPYPMPNLGIQEYKCEIVILGLRNLVSTGLLPINKAFMKFNLKSMLPSDQATAVENIQTQPFENGSNPNIRTTLQFELKMPSDPLFAPRMTCDVFDLLFFESLPQPHIGTFTLKIGDIMIDTIEKNRQKIVDLNKSLESLNAIIPKIEQAKQGRQNFRIQDFINELQQKSALSNVSINSQKSKNQQIKVGHKILQHIEKNGFQIPSSSAIKGGQALQEQKNDIGSAGSKVDIMNINQNDGEQMQKILGANMRKKVQLAFEANQEKLKKELEQARKDDQKNFGKQKDAYKNIVMPIYKFDERLKIEREIEKPPESLFKDLGYDPNPQANKKQYRRYYPDELEKIIDQKSGDLLIKSPFITEKIYRAKQTKAPGLLDQFFGSNQNPEMAVYEVGQFKCNIRCFNEDQNQQDKNQEVELVQKILEKVKIIYESQYPDSKWDFNQNCLDSKIQMSENDVDTQLKLLKKYLGKSGLDKLYLYPLLSEMIFQKLQLQMLNTLTKCKVRLYVIEGFNFAKRDVFSESDPYILIKCGKTQFNERDNYQIDQSNPTFFKSYDFMVDFPGAPVLEIIAYDYDDLFGDDFIGETKIDLDDRYFSQEWWAIDDKPIEYRDLFDHSSTVTQGVVKLWCEINQKDTPEANLPAIDIKPAPSQELELRLVIWKTRDIEARDHDQMCDPYVKAFLDDGVDQSTDVHWRCQNGVGSYNYRLLFPLKSQQPSYQLTIQCWDKDIISSDELIGEAMLDISCLVEDIVLTGRQTVLHQKYFEEYLKGQLQQKGSKIVEDIKFEDDNQTKFWIPIRVLKQPEEKYVGMGEILCSLQVVTKNFQEKSPQGLGRTEPNNDPQLPEPEGRLKLEYNPIAMIQQFVSPQLLRKIMIGLAISVCMLLCLMMLPQIVANLITKLLVG